MEGGGWLQLHWQVAVPEVVSYVIYGKDLIVFVI